MSPSGEIQDVELLASQQRQDGVSNPLQASA